MKTLLLFSLVTLIVTGTLSSADDLDLNITTSELPSEVPTSTEVPTTTVAHTTSTKPIPTTTTEVPTTTTKEPITTLPPVTTTKMPPPDDCQFNVTKGDVTCIRADLKMSFIVSLEGKDNHINLGCNASYLSSDCTSNDTQALVLTATDYNLTMVFEREHDKFSVKEIAFGYNLPGGDGMVSSNTTKIFTVKTGNSYLCKSKSEIHLGNVTIEISEIHVQAFLTKDNKNFGAAEECEADDKVSDVVPIAVGVALAALIIVVLIAYLVGRRRSRQSGYQSV